MSRLVLATRNAGKIRELQTILAESLPGVEVVGLDAFPQLEDVVESGVTFEDNATLKAAYAARMTNLPAVADDSGLAVDVLGGAPGVFSARWAGRHGDDQANLDLLLAQLADVPDEHRGARFRCAAVLALPDGRTVCREGDFPGTLTREPRGDGGFGYDPILQVAGDTRTAAELAPAEKNAISHRGKAFRALAPEVAALLR
ncbi:RdgB/HAM1 family non-canonical purine NTP pyrophosphatase [Arsenicicoccus piscis]|uniref:dITP/XTP pyrophosphatase n=1 Tax=Arsenicicoccus piscis TaxID=673954 RepID=A0ABQ6HKP0_9MICO|nr:RdgB/HAM1 family non-canonical purine NTP pyrophosphatase [Arsenicicoccus piscis]GMA18633.1 non-canonical purine NTP pyrophosphatase [Arsenicicoccus piscis]